MDFSFILFNFIAVIGLCFSILGVSKNTAGKGLGIAGIVLNGLVILSVFIIRL
jgi:hypothetical protein